MFSRNLKLISWSLCILSSYLLVLSLHLWSSWELTGQRPFETTFPATTEAVEFSDGTAETELTEAPGFEPTPERQNPVLALIPGAVGVLLAVWFLLLPIDSLDFKCPELEPLLILGAGYVIYQCRYGMELLVAAWLCMALALLALRSFLRRIPKGFGFEKTLAARLGQRMGTTLGYAALELGLFGFLALGAFAASRLGLVPYVLGLFSLIPLGCILRLAAHMDRLKNQIQKLAANEPAEGISGIFAEESLALASLQQEKDLAVETARQDERFKVELITNVSHDLRTPLTAILGYGELLTGEALSPEGEKRLSLLNRKAGYMRDLVEELFELTKVSSGVSQAQRRDLDLIRLLEQTVGMLEDRMEGLELRRFYPADRFPICTDGARMHRVFDNLLENAIKYALPGSRIYLDVKQEEDFAVIRFTNTASYDMDFRPEEIVRRFVRGDRARSTQGSGIGLAIAETYTESCGGTFHVEVDGDQFRAVVKLPLQN